jgi:hypothetical protein
MIPLPTKMAAIAENRKFDKNVKGEKNILVGRRGHQI